MPKYPCFSLLVPWSSEQQESLIDSLPQLSFASGDTIFEYGDTSNDVFFIIKGGAKSLNYTVDGKLSYFRLRNEGDCFGYYSAISNEPRTANMVAVGDTLLAKMQAEEFFSLVLDNRNVGRNFLKLVVGLLRVETNRLTALTTMTTKERLITELLSNHTTQHPNVFKIHDSVEFASYLGMSRETLSRVLHELEEENLIKIDGENIFLLGLDHT